MESARLPENEERRLSYLRSLDILDTPLEERFNRITRMVCHVLKVPIAAVSLVDSERQWFKSAQGLGAAETSREVAFCAHAILGDEPFVVFDTLQDHRFSDNPLVVGGPKIRFYAGIPLRMAGEFRIGTLCAIDSKPRQVSDDQLEILQDLGEMVKAELAAVKLSAEHAKLISELKQAERAALIDPLTRLWNREGGERLLTLEWLAAKRRAQPMALIMIDVDFFKEVNDEHGHALGDEALRHLASALLQSFRASDIVARWGGDEFIVILPDCGREHLVDTLSRVKAQLHSQPLVHMGIEYKLTVSAGAWNGVPTGGADDARSKLKAADAALYEAKRQGRDQFRLCEIPQ